MHDNINIYGYINKTKINILFEDDMFIKGNFDTFSDHLIKKHNLLHSLTSDISIINGKKLQDYI